MRVQEKNNFDCIIVAGDIGNDSASEFFKILQTFKCPILYVYGNWDHKLSYAKQYIADSELVHLKIARIGRLFLTGFSGCPTNWGRNPFAQKARDKDANIILDLNRQKLKSLISKIGASPERTIVITHERLSRFGEIAPNALLHVFGHIHKFSETDFKGTKFVNVAALDRPISARPRILSEWKPEDCRNFNAGNYTSIEIDRRNRMKIRRVPLVHDYPK